MTWPSSASAQPARPRSINSRGAGSGPSGSIASRRHTSTARPTGTRGSPARRSVRARRTRRWSSGRTRSGETLEAETGQDLLTQCGGLIIEAAGGGAAGHHRHEFLAEHDRLREPVWDPARSAERRGRRAAASPSSRWTATSPPTTSRRPALSARSAASARSSRSRTAPRRRHPPQRARPRRRAVEKRGSGAHRQGSARCGARGPGGGAVGSRLPRCGTAPAVQRVPPGDDVVPVEPGCRRPHTGCDARVHLGPAGRQRLLRFPRDRRDA